MKKLYFIEISHNIILQEMHIEKIDDKTIHLALGCHQERIPTSYIDRDWVMYDGNLCIFALEKEKLINKYQKYKDIIMKNLKRIDEELEGL